MVITDIFDLQKLARRRLPRIVYTYVENGGYEEETLRRNRRDLQAFALVPHVLNDVSHRSLAADMAGTPAAMPIALAPVGACGLTYANGEIEAALAAKEAGIPFSLSTLSIASLEDVAHATKSPFWFQLYMMRDKEVNEALVERAKKCGVSTLLLSMDLHVRSERYGEEKLGLDAPPKFTPRNLLDAITHPRWLFPMVRSKHRTFGNLIGLVKDAKNLSKITIWLEKQFDPTLSTKDIEWARSVWPGKILVKGVLAADDARAAMDHGADGVIVSNHGGRQVDGAVSTIAVLPQIVDAIGGRGHVLVDSGIRSGIDVLKMMARGADGCLIGRAYIYGLAAKGRSGVHKAIDIIRTQLDENMALCGIKDIRSLPPNLLVDEARLLTEHKLIV